MARTEPFERHAGQYEDWFDQHYPAYVSELLALRAAVAESLPFADDSFEHALVVTTICCIDLESRLGRLHEAHRAESVFCRDAEFHSAEDVAGLLTGAGFSIQACNDKPGLRQQR